MNEAEIMPPEANPMAITVAGTITTTEICDMSVAMARKKANLRIRQVRDLIKSSGEELQEKVTELTKACEERVKGFMGDELSAAAASLQSIFGVPVIHKITPLANTFDEESKTFKVQVSIGFEDRTPGIPKISGSSIGFDQDLYMQSKIENGEAVQTLLDTIEEIRKTRKGYTDELAQLEDFLDCGIQVIEDEFKARVTESKIRACRDGDKIMESLEAALADSDVQQLIPASLRGMGLGGPALPAPAAE